MGAPRPVGAAAATSISLIWDDGRQSVVGISSGGEESPSRPGWTRIWGAVHATLSKALKGQRTSS